MKDFLKKTGWVSIITSIAFIIIGLILINNPTEVMNMISSIIGIVIIVSGAIKLINYFSAKGSYDFYNYDLIYGIIAIILGIAVMIYGSVIETIFRLILGTWVIYSGLMRIGLSLKLRTVNASVSYVGIFLAICMLLGGIYIVFNSGALIATIGWIVVIYAVMDLIETVMFLKNMD